MSAEVESALVAELLQKVRDLLDAPRHYLAAEPHVLKLAELYAKLTGVATTQPLANSAHCETERGVAISPVQAAICLNEPLRTKVFLHGIKQAINDAYDRNQRGPVSILYAGTGPYGILLLPLLALLKHIPMRVCLIDIHQDNVDSIRHLVRVLGVDEAVISVETMDACVWQPGAITEFDLLISETMTHLLRREPQVFVFAHLEQFLKPEGCLIPQRISLSASLVDDHRSVELGEFFGLDRHTAKSLREGCRDHYSGSLTVPDELPLPSRLKLDTTIIVYQDHQLTEGDSSLCIPVYKERLYFSERRHIPFYYDFSRQPDFIFDVPTYKPEPILCESSEVGESGLLHLKRFWHKVQLDKVGELDPQLREDELGLDLQLIMQCGGTFHRWLTEAYQQHPPNFQCFEQDIIHRHQLSEADIRRINGSINLT